MSIPIKESQFELRTYTKIKGVTAASGLVFQNETLHIISDDSDVLYVYQKNAQPLTKISLCPSEKTLENRPKPEKSDYEAITFDKQRFYIFGSGSSLNRNKLVIVDQDFLRIEVQSMTGFYEKLKSVSGIDNGNFNIEGAIVTGKDLLLFNRGNGPKQENGIFEIRRWKEETDIRYDPIKLPDIGNTRFGFTDAILIDQSIYFLAAAESSDSTYEDGMVLGSLIGIINRKNKILEWTQVISLNHKFEGLTLYKKKVSKITFLLCEDPDDGRTESEIFELTINRRNL